MTAFSLKYQIRFYLFFLLLLFFFAKNEMHLITVTLLSTDHPTAKKLNKMQVKSSHPLLTLYYNKS